LKNYDTLYVCTYNTLAPSTKHHTLFFALSAPKAQCPSSSHPWLWPKPVRTKQTAKASSKQVLVFVVNQMYYDKDASKNISREEKVEICHGDKYSGSSNRKVTPSLLT